MRNGSISVYLNMYMYIAHRMCNQDTQMDNSRRLHNQFLIFVLFPTL